MDVKAITCRTIVNRTGGFLEAFTHTINPYHGCSLGRTLCGMPDYAPAIIGAWGERRWRVTRGILDRMRDTPTR